VSKLLTKIIIILILTTSCSLDKKIGILKESKIENKKEQKDKKKTIKKLFRLKEVLNAELNPSLEIIIKDSYNDIKKNYHLSNNLGRSNFNKELTKVTKFKFSKIDNFNQNEPEIVFHEGDVIFFDNKGTIIRYNKFKEVVWKSNHYTKAEKKSNPFLYFKKDKDILFVVDSISNFYAVNTKDGSLVWSNKNSSPFNSEIKIYKNKFFVTDFENILHCFSTKDGKKLWSFKTENVLIKSEKKLSIVINKDIVYFNNSIGDITALDIQNGSIIWQLPTQNNSNYANTFSLKNSDLVINDQTIYFSNNKNEFYSVNADTGLLNWKQNINSYVRPVVLEDIIITVSLEGFLIVVEKKSGNIIRITDIFDGFKPKHRKEIYPNNFILGSENIFLTTTNGRLLIINLKSGKNIGVIKVDGNKISEPFLNKKKLFIIKDNSIIRFD